ncbi:MAG: hypothetical protein IE923_09990 [Micrococcales bacterium]|nr:hypothetical protein [Micrococcales bacterium]
MAAVAALSGCADRLSTEELEAEMTARPSMEQMLDHYEAMRREMVQVLDAEIGGLHWVADPVQMGASRSGCSTGGAITEAQEVETIGLLAEGTYESAYWHRSAELVLEVGRRFGFDDTATVADRPGDFEVVGADEYGAVFHYGMAVNTILTLRTGCHLWEDRPGLDHEWPLPLRDPSSTPAPTG